VTVSGGVTTEVYLMSNVASDNTATTAQKRDIKVIRSDYIRPTNGLITQASATASDNFREFRFKPMWYPQITMDAASTPNVAGNMRRFLMPDYDKANYSFTSTDLQRFVRLESANNNNSGFKLTATGSSTTNDLVPSYRPPSTTDAVTGASGVNHTNLIFRATVTSPKLQVRSPKLFYLVRKSDWEKRFESVTSRKQLRYLVWNASPGGSAAARLELKDLYDPDVSESDIKKSAFRLTQNTQVNLTPASAVNGQEGESITSWDTQTTFGFLAYYHNGDVPLGAATNGDPISGTLVAGSTVLKETGTNFVEGQVLASQFTKPDGTGATDTDLTTEITTSGGNGCIGYSFDRTMSYLD
jgi:hypothetical protein